VYGPPVGAITYTTTAGDPALDEAFERALAHAREGVPEPLAHHVEGELRAEGEVFERADPCDGARIVSRAHQAPPEVVAAAVSAARAAQPAWAATPLADRTIALRAIATLIEARRTELAGVVSAETGKVRAEAVPEVQEGADLIETYCADMERHDGYRTPLGRLSEREDNVSVMRPYGVFAVICPFNFPFALAVNMAAGALVGGNTVVLKPAEETPRSTAQLAELAAEAGLPPGVLNLVHGDDAAGRALVAADVDGVAFTGSAEAGHAIAKALHTTPPLRPLIAEMGGKNPAIVTASADLDRAAEGIVRSAYGLSGQKCSSCSRVVVEREVHDALVERIAAGARVLAVGDPADPASALGPVVSSAAVERFEAAVADARRDGELVTGGDHDGCFAAPTLVTSLPRGHRLTRDELFLPFLTVTAVDSFEDALDEANAVEYGLTAGIFSEDESERAAFLDRIEAGVVYVNRREGATTGAWPGIQTFCGWKASGVSGKGGLGPHYLTQFMREQSRTVVVS
jgi:1-pyrroline-5-carboxylate dehydrogenase